MGQFIANSEVPVLRVFEGARKYKSVARAIRRGYVQQNGVCFPRKPYNNRKPTEGRKLNEDKKIIYGQLKRYLSSIRTDRL